MLKQTFVLVVVNKFSQDSNGAKVSLQNISHSGMKGHSCEAR